MGLEENEEERYKDGYREGYSKGYQQGLLDGERSIKERINNLFYTKKTEESNIKWQ